MTMQKAFFIQRPIPVLVETTWELYDRIEPVAVVYGNGRRHFLSEYNSANRLLKQLWRLGRARVNIRGMMCHHGALSRLHVCALNCYLQHFFAVQSLNRLRCGQLHRFTWYKVQETVPIVWSR